MAVDKVFTLTATVKNPLPKQTLNLKPLGDLERVDSEEQQVLPAEHTTSEIAVAWKIKAKKAGNYSLEVTSSNGDTETLPITIEAAEKPRKKDLTFEDVGDALKMSVKLMPPDLSLDLDLDNRVTSRDASIILERYLEQVRQKPKK